MRHANSSVKLLIIAAVCMGGMMSCKNMSAEPESTPSEEKLKALSDWSLTETWGAEITNEQLDAVDPAWKERRAKCLASAKATGHPLDGYELVNVTTDAKGFYFLYFQKATPPGTLSLSTGGHRTCRIPHPDGDVHFMAEG